MFDHFTRYRKVVNLVAEIIFFTKMGKQNSCQLLYSARTSNCKASDSYHKGAYAAFDAQRKSFRMITWPWWVMLIVQGCWNQGSPSIWTGNMANSCILIDCPCASLRARESPTCFDKAIVREFDYLSFHDFIVQINSLELNLDK